MEKSDSQLGADTETPETLRANAQVDAALARYSSHFGNADTSAALADTIMRDVAALRQARAGTLAAPLRDFLKLVSQTPQLQQRLTGTGTPAEFVSQMLRFARESGFTLRKGEVYALLQRYTAANDGELSDEALENVAAAAGPVPLHFAPTGIPGDTHSAGLFSWSFGFKPPKP